MIWSEYQGGNRADTARAGAPQPAFGTVNRSHLTITTCAAAPRLPAAVLHDTAAFSICCTLDCCDFCQVVNSELISVRMLLQVRRSRVSP